MPVDLGYSKEQLDNRGVIMSKVILAFRYGVLAIIAIPALVLFLKCVHWWWLCCNYEPDPIFLVATDDIRVMAGDGTVL